MKKIPFIILSLFSLQFYAQEILNENFFNGMPGWSVLHPVGSSTNVGWSIVNSTQNSNYPYNPTDMIMFNSANIAPGNVYELRSPNFVLNPDRTYELSFKIFRSGTFPTKNDFIAIDTPDLVGQIMRYFGEAPILAAPQWQTVRYILNSSTSNKLIITGISNAGDNIFIDDFYIADITPCDIPTQINVSDIKGSSIVCNFIPQAIQAQEYEYYIAAQGAAAPNFFTVPTGIITGSRQTITGLLENKNYTFWLKSKCAAAYKSDWSAGINFATVCNINPIPYTENFDLSTAVIPICTLVSTGNGNGWRPIIVNSDKMLTIPKSPTAISQSIFKTKAVSLLVGQNYTMTYNTYSDVNTATTGNFPFKLDIDLYVAATNAFITTLVNSQNVVNATVQTFTTANFTVATSGDYALIVNAIGSKGSGNIYVDDLTISIAPCIATTFLNGNWSNGVPDATKRAIFASSYTATTDLRACAITVNSNVNVIFPANKNLTIANDVNVDPTGSLTFESGSYLFQLDRTTNVGKINYKRNANMKRLDFVFWSSPVSNQTLALFSPQTLPNRFNIYNETTNVFTVASGNMIPAKGYCIRAPNNFSATTAVFAGQFTGIPNTGDISIPTTFTNTKGKGYNLIGNPYPSAVSGTAFLNANGGTLYFWTHQSSFVGTTLVNGGAVNYATFNLTGANFATVNGGNQIVPNGIIQAGQGFMCSTTNVKSITFNNTMRVDDNAGQFFRTANQNQNNEDNKFWLNLKNNDGDGSQTLIAYLPNTSTGFDDSYDGTQINNDGNVISTVLNNEDYAIQSRGDFDMSDVVKLKLKIDTAESYQISNAAVNGIFNQNQNFYLKDNLLGTTHNIKESPYSFVSEAGVFANRFEIVYQANLSNNNNLFTKENTIVFIQNEVLNVVSTENLKSVKIFDIQGRTVFETNAINSKNCVLNNFSPKEQVLIVNITDTNNQMVTKKIVF